jgi:hypothetical protein
MRCLTDFVCVWGWAHCWLALCWSCCCLRVHFVSADFKPKNWDAALRSLFPNNFWSHFDLQNYATSLQGYMQLYLKIFGNYFGVAARSFVGVTQSRSPLVPRRGEGGAAGQPATHGIRTAYAWLLRRHCMWRMAMRRASDSVPWNAPWSVRSPWQASKVLHHRPKPAARRDRDQCHQWDQWDQYETNMRPMSVMSTETDRIAKTVLQMMTNRGDRRDIGGRRRTRKIRSIQK